MEIDSKDNPADAAYWYGWQKHVLLVNRKALTRNCIQCDRLLVTNLRRFCDPKCNYFYILHNKSLYAKNTLFIAKSKYLRKSMQVEKEKPQDVTPAAQVGRQ